MPRAVLNTGFNHSFYFSVKPRFNINGTFLVDTTEDSETKFVRVVVVEGDTKNISVNAEGNPPQIQYSWAFPEMAETGSQDFRRRVQVSLY